jgi:Ni/Co efflux regulator RcnB
VMNSQRLAMTLAAAALFAFSYSLVGAQRDQNQQSHDTFDDHDRQVTRDWYNHHQDHAPAGLRKEDRLSPEQESRLKPGAQLDPELRKKVHNPPADLVRQLPPPPRNHRYVTIGGHVASVDKNYRVKDVIHVHEGENH